MQLTCCAGRCCVTQHAQRCQPAGACPLLLPTISLLPFTHSPHPPTPPTARRSSERRGGSRLSDLLEDAPLSGAELGAMLPAVGEEEELEEEEEEGSEGGSAKRRRSVSMGRQRDPRNIVAAGWPQGMLRNAAHLLI